MIWYISSYVMNYLLCTGKNYSWIVSDLLYDSTTCFCYLVYLYQVWWYSQCGSHQLFLGDLISQWVAQFKVQLNFYVLVTLQCKIVVLLSILVSVITRPINLRLLSVGVHHELHSRPERPWMTHHRSSQYPRICWHESEQRSCTVSPSVMSPTGFASNIWGAEVKLGKLSYSCEYSCVRFVPLQIN